MKNKSKQKKISAQQHPTKITEEGKQVQDDQNSEDSENSDSDNSGVDERGMERLMAALGDDGLDDVAKKMLTALDERTNEAEGSQKSNESISEGEDGEGTEDGEDDYSDEVDSEEDEEDYVPKVKLRAEKDDEDEDDDEESDSESDNEKDKEKKIMKKKKAANLIPKESRNKVNVPQDHDNQVSGIPLDEVSDLDEDTIPQQKLTVNNKHALDSILRSIELDQSLPWTETLITTYPQIHEVDVSNDLERELSFYKQALHSAEAAKKLAADHSLPFTRPSDFFAEMVKSDAHMERTRQRLLDETAQIKRGEEKRREREGKKFGKQVQIEKLKERERSKKELGETIQSLKRKRKGGALGDGQDGDFDIALEEAVEDRPKKKSKMPRNKKNEKYGFGGKGSVGWRAKQNTRDSTDQFVSGKMGKKGNKGGKHVPNRPGKARRMAHRQK